MEIFEYARQLMINERDRLLGKPVDVSTKHRDLPERANDITPVHADPDSTPLELAAILRVHAARMVRLHTGWELIATDLNAAANTLEALDDVREDRDFIREQIRLYKNGNANLSKRVAELEAQLRGRA
jgi:hypothetical protein